MKLPIDLQSVLAAPFIRRMEAEIKHTNDLGTSVYYEVVYYDTEVNQWCGYYGGSDFSDGETVLRWIYCKDVEF